MTSTATATATATQLRFNTSKTGLSAPDELYWYNNNTCWNSLSRKEFRAVMIRMESVTTQFYDDYADCMYPSRCAAIKKFWADEWGCEYLPETGKWLDLASKTILQSETEKKAQRDLKKAQAKAEKAWTKAAKSQAKDTQIQTQSQNQNQNQYNDEEEELYEQAYTVIKSQSEKARLEEEASAREYALAKAQKAQQAQQAQQQQPKYDYDSWCDEEEEAYAEAYAQAQKEQQKQKEQKEQKEQEEAQAYLDSLAQEYADEEEEEEEPATRITCQPVFYFEELTNVKGDPDWRAYIYYDSRTRRYVLKGTRRSLLTYNKKKTVYPELQLCFRSSRQLASYLCSSTDDTMNITMFAMAAATVKDATFTELYALPARGGHKTELFGYDNTRPRYSTFINYLRMLSDVDASRSNFAGF